MLMFTDIFPYMLSPPEPMNIDPPLPVDMELRLIVFDVTDVETVEEVPPEKPDSDTLHDLMIRGWVFCLKKSHYSHNLINGHFPLPK